MYNHQLETFIKVADSGSFNKASQELYISTNAVMKQINLLEERLGFELFERSPKGLKLTPAGISIYQDSKYIIQYCQDAIARAELKSKENQIIRVGKSFTTPVDFIFNYYDQITKLHPMMKFEFISFENTPTNAKEIMTHFGQNIDLVAGIYSDNFLKDRNSQALKLYDTPLMIGVPYNHRLYNHTVLSYKDLKDETIMIIRPVYMTPFDEVRRKLSSFPDLKLEEFDFFNVDTFNKCVNDNKLMITVKEWEDIHPMMKMIPIEWDYTIPFGIIYSLHPNKNVEILIDTLKQLL